MFGHSGTGAHSVRLGLLPQRPVLARSRESEPPNSDSESPSLGRLTFTFNLKVGLSHCSANATLNQVGLSHAGPGAPASGSSKFHWQVRCFPSQPASQPVSVPVQSPHQLPRPGTWCWIAPWQRWILSWIGQRLRGTYRLRVRENAPSCSGCVFEDSEFGWLCEASYRLPQCSICTKCCALCKEARHAQRTGKCPLFRECSIFCLLVCKQASGTFGVHACECSRPPTGIPQHAESINVSHDSDLHADLTDEYSS
jgi:hypothetical protein